MSTHCSSTERILCVLVIFPFLSTIIIMSCWTIEFHFISYSICYTQSHLYNDFCTLAQILHFISYSNLCYNILYNAILTITGVNFFPFPIHLTVYIIMSDLAFHFSYSNLCIMLFLLFRIIFLGVDLTIVGSWLIIVSIL